MIEMIKKGRRSPAIIFPLVLYGFQDIHYFAIVESRATAITTEYVPILSATRSAATSGFFRKKGKVVYPVKKRLLDRKKLAP